MKKLFLILAAATTLFISCQNNTTSNKETEKSVPNLNGIKDFAKYVAIGAGSFDNGSRSLRTVSIETASGTKLVGELEDGSLELVTFTDEDGTSTEQTWNLSALTVDTNFAFLGFTQNTVTTILNGKMNNSDTNYLLDMTNGNLYSLDVFNFTAIGPASGNVTLVSGTINDITGIYSFELEDEKVKIEYICDADLFNITNAKTDRYNTTVSGKMKYKDGKVTVLSTSYALNKINNVFYSQDKDASYKYLYSYKLDSTGSEITNTDNYTLYDYPSFINVLETTDNSIKFFNEDALANGIIYTITFTDSDKLTYSVESKNIYVTNDNYWSYLVSTSYIIVLPRIRNENDIVVIKYDIEADTFTTIVNITGNLKLTDKCTENYIHFTYTNSSLDEKDVYVYPDGTVSETEIDNSSNYTVSYLTAIN